MQVSRRGSRERGATAILVAMVSLVLMGMAAFTTDFGVAYVSKRQLQTASDSAALAGASVYATKPGSCSSLVGNATYRQAAELAADGIRAQNRPASTRTAMSVTCNALQQLVVSYSSSGTTPAGLSAIFGADDEIETERSADATLSVATSVDKALRPYAICSVDVPTSSPIAPVVVKVEQPGQAHTPVQCPTADNPGDWWTVDCPEDNNNGNGTLANALLNGCSDEVGIVPNQPASALPPVLGAFLIAACPTRSMSCLAANSGNDLHSTAVNNAWNTLLGKSIVLPVFCGDPLCLPAGVTGAGGNNAIYPVYKLASVTVCGYHWKNRDAEITTGVCANNPSNFHSSQGGSHDNYMLLVFTQVQVTGSTKSSTCALAASCDGGLRRTLLTQ